MTKTFTEKVYDVTRRIPRGKVATYGQVAELAGSPGSARAVGMAMRRNPDAPNTPCHRVVASDGSLRGYSGYGGLTAKKRMLKKEGVLFSEGKVNLKLSHWGKVNSLKK